jgi:hypothetical protein
MKSGGVRTLLICCCLKEINLSYPNYFWIFSPEIKLPFFQSICVQFTRFVGLLSTVYSTGHVCWNSKCRLPFRVFRPRKTIFRFLFAANKRKLPFPLFPFFLYIYGKRNYIIYIFMYLCRPSEASPWCYAVPGGNHLGTDRVCHGLGRGQIGTQSWNF